jgi:hypothetical protein
MIFHVQEINSRGPEEKTIQTEITGNILEEGTIGGIIARGIYTTFIDTLITPKCRGLM